MFPCRSTATHSAVLGHEMPVKKLFALTRANAQVAPPSVDVPTFPTSSTATHSPDVGHDTPVISTVDPNGDWASISFCDDHVSGALPSAAAGGAAQTATTTRARTTRWRIGDQV